MSSGLQECWHRARFGQGRVSRRGGASAILDRSCARCRCAIRPGRRNRRPQPNQATTSSDRRGRPTCHHRIGIDQQLARTRRQRRRPRFAALAQPPMQRLQSRVPKRRVRQRRQTATAASSPDHPRYAFLRDAAHFDARTAQARPATPPDRGSPDPTPASAPPPPTLSAPHTRECCTPDRTEGPDPRAGATPPPSAPSPHPAAARAA